MINSSSINRTEKLVTLGILALVGFILFYEKDDVPIVGHMIMKVVYLFVENPITIILIVWSIATLVGVNLIQLLIGLFKKARNTIVNFINGFTKENTNVEGAGDSIA